MKKGIIGKALLALLTIYTTFSFTGCAKVTISPDKAKDVHVSGTNRCFILDTDWLADVDDAVAVRYLVRKHLAGEITLLGINVDAQIETSAPSLDSFVSAEGVRLPIAVDHEGTGLGKVSLYHAPAIRHGGGSTYGTSLEYPDSVGFYRKILSSLPEGVKCDIISVGFMNSLARLLESQADEYSPLSGEALVREKVGTLWAMAGEFPSGKEFNIRHKPLSIQAATTVSERWSTPVVFLGFECGKDVITGGTVRSELGRNDLLYRCLRAHCHPFGRSSWDPMTAYLAVVGSPEEAGFSTVVGRIRISSDGSNEFDVTPDGTHCYVVKEKSDDFYRDKIDEVVARAN